MRLALLRCRGRLQKVSKRRVYSELRRATLLLLRVVMIHIGLTRTHEYSIAGLNEILTVGRAGL